MWKKFYYNLLDNDLCASASCFQTDVQFLFEPQSPALLTAYPTIGLWAQHDVEMIKEVGIYKSHLMVSKTVVKIR